MRFYKIAWQIGRLCEHTDHDVLKIFLNVIVGVCHQHRGNDDGDGGLHLKNEEHKVKVEGSKATKKNLNPTTHKLAQGNPTAAKKSSRSLALRPRLRTFI